MGVSVDQLLKQYARRLRCNMTDAERKLWQSLRQRQLLSCRFRRQVVIGGYIVDFACLEVRLVVEVDGGQHNESAADLGRDADLALNGFRVLRFWNNDVLLNIEGVLQAIAEAVQSPPPSNLPPSRGKAKSARTEQHSA
jgi:very-short-patch-repair endonuclease